MKRLSFIFMFLSLLGFMSCHNDKVVDVEKGNEEEVPQMPSSFEKKTEEIEGGSITYKYKDGVVVLTDANKQYLTKVESDTVLFFTKPAADAFKLAKGSIISSGLVNEVTPYGLGNKVLTVENAGDKVRCVTTHAALDEIFEVLDLKANIDLIADTISRIVTDADGDVVEISAEKSLQTKANDDLGKLAVFKYAKTHNQLYAKGQVTLRAVATIDIDLEKGESECSLAVSADVDGNIGAEASCEVEVPVLPEITLVQGVVAVGPVVLRPYIKAEFNLKGSLEGSVDAKLSKRFAGKFGLKDGKAFSKNNTPEDNDVIKEITVDAKGEIFFVTQLNFATGLYTKDVAAGVGVNASTGFAADFRLGYADLFMMKPSLDFKVIGNALVFLKAEFWGLKLMEKEASIASQEFYKKSFPLLPTYVKKSLVVNKREGESPLVYDATYKLNGGFLNNGMDIIPALRVYKGDKKICEILDYDHDMNDFNTDVTNHFEIKDLDPNETYVAKPSLRVAGLYYYDENGVTFPNICPDDKHKHAIDLGLPSGTLWSCYNVGATKPEELGGRFAWGETKEKSYYKLDNYQHGQYPNIGDKNHNIAGTKYDIATELWGKVIDKSSGESLEWRIPTKVQMEELFALPKKYHVINGTEGVLFQGNNGNCIFMPYISSKGKVEDTFYWTSNQVYKDNGEWDDECHCGNLDLKEGGHAQAKFRESKAYEGLFVRPVLVKTDK